MLGFDEALYLSGVAIMHFYLGGGNTSATCLSALHDCC